MSSLLEKVITAVELKNLKRSGWVEWKIPEPESVADHSWNVALLAMIIPVPEGIDRNELIQMAVLHDLAEVHAGDIICQRGKKVDEELTKQRDESELEFFGEFFEHNELLMRLSTEAVKQETRTGKYLKELDKLDMSLTAFMYEKKTGKPLNTFFETSLMTIKTEPVKSLHDDLLKLRSSDEEFLL